MSRVLVAIALFLATLAGVAAFGLTPAKVTVSDGAFVFTVLGNEQGVLGVRVEGDLADRIDAAIVGRRIEGTIRGGDISPGVHTQRVIVSLVPERSAGTIGARTELAGLLIVKVPYPEEYLEADWDVSEDGGSGTLSFTVTVENLGNKTAVLADAAIEVVGTTLPLETPAIPPGELVQLRVRHDPGDREPGVYAATLTLRYAQETLVRQREIAIGAPDVTVDSVVYNSEQGVIAPIDVQGVVRWNRPLRGTLEVFLDNDTLPAIVQDVEVNGMFNERVYLDTQEHGVPGRIVAAMTVGGMRAAAELVILPEHTVFPWAVAAGAVLLLALIMSWVLRRKIL